MTKDRSRLEPVAPPRGERLEDRYGKIGIPAVAAALGASRPKTEDSRKQMSAGRAWPLNDDAQS